MKLSTLYLLIFLAVLCSYAHSQGQVSQPVRKDTIVYVYGPRAYAERMPFLPGGERLSNERRRQQIIDAAQANLTLPPGFRRLKKSAKVFVSFVLTTSAQVTDVKIIKTDDKLNLDCANAAVAAVRRLLGFTAGFEKGNAVAMSVVVPVEFGVVQK